jgi:pimeloyl-ACP methyl ester carboxylesterase
MRPLLPAAFAFLLAALPGSVQQAAPWHDPSPHKVQFVTVDKDIKLEVLDWGGTGRPIVLLAGLGATAHTYDDFAPKLTPEYHVYGITRRGFGASSAPVSGYSADRLGDDVLAVLDALTLDSPVLAGQSIAGEELSSIGSRHPERVSALVYLDAAYSYAYYDPWIKDDPQTSQPMPPPPTAEDRKSFEAWRSWQKRVYGNASPEGELRQQREVMPDGSVGEFRTNPAVVRAIIAGGQKYTNIRVPSLAIFAVPHDPGLFAEKDAVALSTFEASDAASTEAQARAFETGVPSARVVRLPHANHAIYMSNEADVLREMRAFIGGLK